MKVAKADESALRINEVVAENKATIKDPQGDFDDYIEIVNTSDAEVDLAGKFLTDNKKNPRKWKFPKGTKIEANGRLVIWADENGKAKDGLHANFKLAKSGETIQLVDKRLRQPNPRRAGSPSSKPTRLRRLPTATVSQPSAASPAKQTNNPAQQPLFNSPCLSGLFSFGRASTSLALLPLPISCSRLKNICLQFPVAFPPWPSPWPSRHLPTLSSSW